MVKNVKKASAAVIGSLHQFTEDEVVTVRQKLLTWYDANHRVLPWRTIAATEPDRSKRAYAVWVSEIMLQQTQVSTVVSYFVKWMAKWPTVEDLARATLEEVNQVWAGLGYYSRARRLHEGAVKVVKELDGEFPDDRDSLIQHLPGIGRYSGSAIASIALGCGVGVVDGNVNRVFARVRGIGADITLQSTTEHMWTLANQLVDSDRPGDFNQAMMEFGATVCTPKNPSCNSCPLSVHCVSHHRSGDQQERASITNHFKKRKMPSESSAVPDIECLPECALCLRKEDWDSSLGVQNYPRKAQKTQSRQKASAVVVLQGNSGEMLLVQRPKKGLLANLWEFPSIALTDGDSHQEKEVTEQLINQFAVPSSLSSSRIFVADVIHIFSHIRQTYKVYKILLDDQKGLTWPSRYQGGQWMTRKEFVTSATSTAMKKVLKAVEVSEEKNKNEKKMGLVEKSPDTKKQKTISQFFTAAPKKK
ncbi:adenine DNA glycosylase-like [Homarus americanus]|uniref:adenine DNA glycosylase-like n=1 Tax=Homarus americanus TaxID=6706 RepID=UPI001C465C45|nr:adenine DNA glycosylase-like [Homarus americanus]